MALIACTPKQDLPVYQDESRDLDERVADALSLMTTEEKIAIIKNKKKAKDKTQKKRKAQIIAKNDPKNK